MGENKERVALGQRPPVDAHAEAELGDGPVVVRSEVNQEAAEVGTARDVVALDRTPPTALLAEGLSDVPTDGPRVGASEIRGRAEGQALPARQGQRVERPLACEGVRPKQPPAAAAASHRSTHGPFRDVSLSALALRTGLSVPYLSRVRRGEEVPHPRWWDLLRSG